MKEMHYAPVALFAYRRLDHLSVTLKSLASNPEAKYTNLTIFCDGAKNPEHQAEVDAVRLYAQTIQGFASVNIVNRENNWGLAANIIDGVTQVIRSYGRVIVVEDDLKLSPYFLSFMNDALIRYSNDDRVISIHGYVYPVLKKLPEAFFLRGADCWGWATWERGWALFNPDGRYLLNQLKERQLINEFDFNGSYPFSTMLQKQIDGKNDSWAIRWHASAFIHDKLTLHPGRSLVQNIGNDSSGTHCSESNYYDVDLQSAPINLNSIEVSPSLDGKLAFEDFYRRTQKSLIRKIFQKIRISMSLLL